MGEFYKRLVVDPPKGYAEFYQEVKDLLLMAKDDWPTKTTFPYTYESYDKDKWFEKWHGNQSSIETTKKPEIPQTINILDKIELGKQYLLKSHMTVLDGYWFNPNHEGHIFTPTEKVPSRTRPYNYMDYCFGKCACGQQFSVPASFLTVVNRLQERSEND